MTIRYFQNPNDGNNVYGYDSADASQNASITNAVDNKWVEVTGNWPPTPTAAQQLAWAVASLEVKVQNYLDNTAQKKGYDSAASCISYLNSSNTTWKADATAMNTWRDAVWAACYANEASVTTTTNWAQVLAVLPAAPW